MGYTLEQTRMIVDSTMKKFVRAKGNDYYLYLAVLKKHLGGELADAVSKLREEHETDGVSFADLCHLLVRFEFPVNRMKSLMSILEDCGAIPSRMYRQTKYLGVKKSLIELGYEKCPNADCWRWFGHDEECRCEKKAK